MTTNRFVSSEETKWYRILQGQTDNTTRKIYKMKVTEKGHTTIIKDSNDHLGELIAKLTHEIKTFKSQNLII